MKNSTPKRYQKLLGQGHDISPFNGLSAELRTSRECPPVVTIKQTGGTTTKLGDILPFIRGLRLSARLIYILREKLKDGNVEVNWGHIEDDRQRMCSPECDIVIHRGGIVERWNGHDHHSVMDFVFIKRDAVKAVISCKSKLDSVDVAFARVLKKSFKIHNSFLFAEVIEEAKYKNLAQKAKNAGYKGLWCLYRLDANGTQKQDPQDYLDFLGALRKIL